MKKIITVLAITAFMSGCASIIKGGTQNVNISTSDGKEVEATVFTKAGSQETQLPRVISVKKDSQDITIAVKENECYDETVTVTSSHIEPWFWGNILSGGIVGSTTDSVTGAMWTYDDNVVVNLNEKSSCVK